MQQKNNHSVSVKIYRGSLRFAKWLALSLLTVITVIVVLEFALAVITTAIGQNVTVASAIIETSMITALTVLLFTKWNVYQMWRQFFAKLLVRTAKIQSVRTRQAAVRKAAKKTVKQKKTAK